MNSGLDAQTQRNQLTQSTTKNPRSWWLDVDFFSPVFLLSLFFKARELTWLQCNSRLMLRWLNKGRQYVTDRLHLTKKCAEDPYLYLKNKRTIKENQKIAHLLRMLQEYSSPFLFSQATKHLTNEKPPKIIHTYSSLIKFMKIFFASYWYSVQSGKFKSVYLLNG